MNKSMKTLIVAITSLVACVALLVAGTYALWSAQFDFTNHLQAGTMKAELYREKLTVVKLDDAGYPKTITDTTVVGSDEVDNLFGIETGNLIVPGSSFKADLRLDNKGDVAFGYWIEIKLKSANNELAQQLKVIVTVNNAATDAKLNNGLTVGSDDVFIGTVGTQANNASAYFTVEVVLENLPGTENNSAMNKTAEFDLIVHATQVVAS